jgi:hypothetical protein
MPISDRRLSRHREKIVGAVEFPVANGSPEGNRIIQSLWIGSPLSLMETLCIRSYLSHGHEFHLYTYGDVGNIPEGTTLRDANEVMPQSVADKFKYKANFSDYFRFTMLLKGGWYVDMDSICLRPLDFSSEYIFGSCGCDTMYNPVSDLSSSVGKFIGSAFIKVPDSNEVMEYCRGCVENWVQGAEQIYDEPMRIVQRAIVKFGFEEYVQAPIVFDPVPYYRLVEVVNPATSWDLKKAYVVHLSRSGWLGGSAAHQELNVDGKYSANCLFEQLKKKYL